MARSSSVPVAAFGKALNNSPRALRGEMLEAEGGLRCRPTAIAVSGRAGEGPPLSLRDISPRGAGGEGIRLVQRFPRWFDGSCASAVRRTWKFTRGAALRATRGTTVRLREVVRRAGGGIPPSRGIARAAGTDAFSQSGKSSSSWLKRRASSGYISSSSSLKSRWLRQSGVAAAAAAERRASSASSASVPYSIVRQYSTYAGSPSSSAIFDPALAIELAALFPGQLGFRNHVTLRSCSCPPIVARRGEHVQRDRCGWG